MNENINQSDEFMELMSSFQPRLYGYILSLIGNADLANDVLQETNLVLWRKSGEFEPGTSFRAWSFRVAHFQVMAQRQKQMRERIMFDDELLITLGKEAKEADELLEERTEHLAQCIAKLNPRHKELIEMRYSNGISVKAMAESLKQSANTITQALFRARTNLIQCVQNSQLKEA